MSKAKIIQIFGRRGTGKSNRARNLCRQYDRILIVDRLCCDYSDGIIFESLEELKAFWNTTCKGKFRLIYRPSHFDDKRLCNELDTLAGWVMKCGNMAFLIEELNVIFDGLDLPKNLNTCIYAGRKQWQGKSGGQVELITVSQRPKGYGKALLSQAEIFNVFQTTDPDDLKYFRDYMDSTVLDMIKTLPEYHYVHWDFSKEAGNRAEICKDEYLQVD